MSNINETLNSEKEGVVSMGTKRMVVEGFNPNDYLQRYEDGTAYLPFKVQLAWFRQEYPNGKTVVYRPQWSEEKEPQTYVATARVYADANDAVDSFLAEASAKRGPGLVVHDTDVAIDPYNAVQVAALSLALKLAGYWITLTDDDKTPIPTTDEAPENKPAPAAVSENSTTTAESDTPVKKRGRRKAKGDVTTAESATTSESNNQVADSASAENVVENPAPAEEETANDATPAEKSTTSEEAAPETDAAEEAAVEESVDENAGEAENVEENKPATESSDENAPENAEMASAEEEKPESDSSTEEAPKPQVTIDEAELAELRAVPHTTGYYNGTIGDLEAQRMEGNELCTNLFNWLIHSNMAKKKNPTQHAAAKRIAEAVHPDWIANIKNG